MAGKSNTSATFFAQKKLLGKAHTSNLKTDGEEVIGSNIQAPSSQVFGETIPESPSTTLYLLQSASDGAPATVEYIQFTLAALTGTTYDANSSGGGAGSDSGEDSQSSGVHTYKFRLPSDYSDSSSNPLVGNGTFDNNKIVHHTLGGLQLIPPFFSQTSPNPYIVKIYKDNGSGGVGDEIPLLDNIDWNVDYYNGILFLQDYISSKVPAFAKAFAYVGKFADKGMFASGLSGSLTKLTDGTSYLAAGSNITITSASNGQVTIAASGGGVAGSDTQIQFNDGGSFGGDSGLAYNKTTNYLTASGGIVAGIVTASNGLTGSLTRLSDGTSYLAAGSNITITSASNGQVTITSADTDTQNTLDQAYDEGGSGLGAIITVDNQPVQLKVSGGTSTALAITGSVLIGSGADGSMPPLPGTDTNFFVSGTVGGRRTTGTSVFGGDVVISGTLYSEKQVIEVDELVPGQMLVSGSLFVSKSAVFNEPGGDHDFTVKSSNKSHAIFVDGSTDQVLILSGGSAGSPNQGAATDTNFFVSGSVGSKGTDVKGTSVFGGDVVISGTVYGGSPLKIEGGMSVTGTFELKPNSGNDAILRSRTGPILLFANDKIRMSSGIGKIELVDLGAGVAGNIIMTGSGGVAARSVSLGSPGRLDFTGSNGGSNFKGAVNFNDGISGSLTRLNDGTSFIQGSNRVTVTSASGGQVTISSPNYVFNEYMGLGDGSKTLFALTYTPTSNKDVSVFVNGLHQMPATSLTSAPFQDYSITGSNIFFTTASLPEYGSIIFANYTTNQTVT